MHALTFIIILLYLLVTLMFSKARRMDTVRSAGLYKDQVTVYKLHIQKLYSKLIGYDKICDN